MKKIVFAFLFSLASVSNAKSITLANPEKWLTQLVSQQSTQKIEAANRQGSKRVGGSGRSGKGGHYVGGRRR